MNCMSNDFFWPIASTLASLCILGEPGPGQPICHGGHFNALSSMTLHALLSALSPSGMYTVLCTMLWWKTNAFVWIYVCSKKKKIFPKENWHKTKQNCINFNAIVLCVQQQIQYSVGFNVQNMSNTTFVRADVAHSVQLHCNGALRREVRHCNVL